MAISTNRPLAQLKPGDLVTVNSDFGILGFVCWVSTPEGCSPDIGYLGLDGEYHERTAFPSYTVWLEHPMIGARRHVEASAASWACECHRGQAGRK